MSDFVIDGIDFQELEAEKYWSFNARKPIEWKKEERNKMIYSGQYWGTEKKDGAYYRFIKGMNGNMRLQGRSRNVQKEFLNKIENAIEKAVAAGNDTDARQFLAQKKIYTDQLSSLEGTYQVASENAAKMRNMHDKLVSDIDQLNAKKASIKAKMAAAKTQQRMNKIGSSAAGVANDMSAFDRMEDKANQMLDEANAMSELNKTAAESSIDALTSKYDSPANDSSLDDELDALKAQMGK